MGWFPVQLPWWVAGPLLGICVAGMYAVTNKSLGASGTYAQITDKILRKPVKEPWRLWFMAGVIIGALIYAVFSTGFTWNWNYGQLSHALSFPNLLLVLFFGGLLMGWGARWAGGCTSGHGLCGTATRSPASFAATMSFFITAVVVTFAIHELSGGLL